jgi:hypothetical protein
MTAINPDEDSTTGDSWVLPADHLAHQDSYAMPGRLRRLRRCAGLGVHAYARTYARAFLNHLSAVSSKLIRA